MTYVFKDQKTGEIIRREHDTLTYDQMTEYIRDGFRLLYIEDDKPTEPIVIMR